MNFRALLAIALLTMSSLAFSETRLPHIVILATGGTIAGSAASNTQTTGYKAGAIGVQTLINAVPEMSKIAHVEGEQVANIGSENMTSDIILQLSKRVNALLARDDVDGVVITHGTDTLDETPYFLNLTVKSNKPVVFTAAMRPATAISADGPMNLLEAVTVAADPDARGRGVMVVLNDRIGAARFVTKTNATSLDTFRAPEEGYLGVVVGGKPQFETRVDKIHTLRSVFDVRQLKVLPKVVIIYGYQTIRSICTMRRSPIMPTVLSTPEPGRGRCRYVAPPVSKKRSRRASWWCEPPVPAAASYRRMTASPGWWPTPSTRQKRVYC